MLKKVLKLLITSFTFWFVVLSLLIIWNHYSGGDSKSIVLIYFNVILEGISLNDVGRELMNSGPEISAKTILGEISVYWYIAHLLSFILYGAVLDGIKAVFKLLLRTPSKGVSA